VPWVVDTCLVLDVLENDPRFGEQSAQLVDARLGEGLVLCPVSFVELAPTFEGSVERQRFFLSQVGIRFDEEWRLEDTEKAHALWHGHVKRRRMRSVPKRPIADALIAAFAGRFRGLLTRNSADFRKLDATLRLLEP
jgi:predicted nucleic acid-binding protein